MEDCVIQLQKTSKASSQPFSIRVGYLYNQGLNNYKDTKPPISAFLENLPVKGPGGRFYLSEAPGGKAIL
jgi:hypothetical protein